MWNYINHIFEFCHIPQYLLVNEVVVFKFWIIHVILPYVDYMLGMYLWIIQYLEDGSHNHYFNLASHVKIQFHTTPKTGIDNAS